MTTDGTTDAGTGAGTNTGADGGQDAGQEHGGELKGNSLMTKPGGEGGEPADGGQDAGKEQNKAKDDPADKVPDKPEGYELKFAEGTQVDQALLADFQKEAHALGIKPTQAQKLASMYEAHVAKAGEAAAAEQRRVVEEAKKGWEAEIEKLPTFTQDRAHIQSALRQYGDQELYELLDQTNLGSHPKMWAFMAKIGKELAEPGFHGKGGDKKEAPLATRLWPNM